MTPRRPPKAASLAFALGLACAWGAAPAGAAFSERDAGTSTAQFLRLGVSARTVAMGEAGAASVRGPAAMHYNPAGMTSMPSAAATFMFADHLAGSNYQYFAAATKLGFRNALGISITRFSAGEITTRDSTGARTGAVTPRDIAVKIGAARWITDDRFGPFTGSSFGLTIGIVSSKLTTNATTLTGGFGVRTPAFIGGRVRFGLSGDNLFGSLRFDREADPLPAIVRLGAQIEAARGWDVALELDFPNDQAPFVAAGLELDLSPLFLRAGFNNRSDIGLDGAVGASGGFGVMWRRWRLDYALLPFGDLGLAHRVSLTSRF